MKKWFRIYLKQKEMTSQIGINLSVMHLNTFISETENWVSETRKGHGEDHVIEDIMPKDSVLATFTLGARSRHSSSEQSSTSSAHIKAKAKHAAVVAYAAALKKNQELDAEELKLEAKCEHVEMETETAASTARLETVNMKMLVMT